MQGYLDRSRCPLCRAQATREAMVLDGIRSSVCSCGFMFVRDVPSAAEISAFYENAPCDERKKNGQQVNAAVNHKVFRRFVKSPAGKSVMDVGSGYGFFLDKLSGCGMSRRVGIELSRTERHYARSCHGLEVHARFDELAGDDRFDIITLFEVIEHILDPPAFLDELCRRLRPGGTVIIGTDNFSSGVVKALGEGFPKWIPHAHISYFMPDTLRALVQKHAGLDIVGELSFTPWELRLRQIVHRLTQGKRGGKSYSRQSELRTSARPYRAFALRRTVNTLWFGLTKSADLRGEMMYVVGRKAG